MNLDIYTTEMSKSIWDKAFFMDKIPGAKCVVDFGCADGVMIRMLAPLFPDIRFYGYDKDDNMIKLAKEKNSASNVYFYESWELGWLSRAVSSAFSEDEICVNFSSVLHEVFSFDDEIYVKELIKELHPKYITIRDMYWHYDGDPYISNVGVIHILSRLKPGYYPSFVKKYGYIHDWKRMTHFLMKYQWKDNGWEEELEENYYSWQIGQFMKLVDNNYDTIFENHYQLPHLIEKWFKSPGIFMPEAHTHAQFILRRKD